MTRHVRWAWAQLTSMRTALVLLFALALAAIPGSVVPQRSISSFQVTEFMNQHPTLGPVYDRLGLFSVYSSPWFSAIYLLLFISLIGCIIPRIGTYARALRARPPATPRQLRRLPAYASTATTAGATAVLDAAEQRLRAQRFRVVRDDTSVAAERGYLREAGNLVFHLSLVVVLVGVALGVATGFRGSSVVVVGGGFSNTLPQYNELTAGARFDPDDLEPFTVVLDSFDAQFETGEVQTGAARVLRAEVTVIDEPGAAPRTATIEPNHPVTIDGTSVHMVAHGYAPVVTVRDGNGDVAYSGPVVFLPQDSNLSSAGVIKAPDGRPQRLAFEGFFLPTGTIDDLGPRSLFPAPINPLLILNAWHGPPAQETGESENVYVLNPAGLTPVPADQGTDRLRFGLQPGQTRELPDDLGSITFDGYERWVKLQISRTPGLWLTVGAIMLAVVGLCLSLFIRPRRLWVKVTPADPNADDAATTPTAPSRLPLMVEVGGLDRADARSGLTEDIESLLAVVPHDEGERA